MDMEPAAEHTPCTAGGSWLRSVHSRLTQTRALLDEINVIFRQVMANPVPCWLSCSLVCLCSGLLTPQGIAQPAACRAKHISVLCR